MNVDPVGEPTPDEWAVWWNILRPDRLRIASEIERAASRYRRAENREAADALEWTAAWLRAAAGGAQ